MRRFLNTIFTWWHDRTLGTALHTARRGVEVGTDAQGNRYYQDKDGRAINGKPRRWVIYNGDIEASRVPPEWHGWLHYTFDEPPHEAETAARDWFRPHKANPTGTREAHRPHAARPQESGYAPWKPER